MIGNIKVVANLLFWMLLLCRGTTRQKLYSKKVVGAITLYMIGLPIITAVTFYNFEKKFTIFSFMYLLLTVNNIQVYCLYLLNRPGNDAERESGEKHSITLLRSEESYGRVFP